MNKTFFTLLWCVLFLLACKPTDKSKKSSVPLPATNTFQDYTIGALQEKQDSSFFSAEFSFKKAFEAANKEEKQKCALAYARCFIRNHKSAPANEVIASIDKKSVESIQLELYLMYQLLQARESKKEDLKTHFKQLKRLHAQLNKKKQDESLGARSEYYLGINYGLLAQKWHFYLPSKRAQKTIQQTQAEAVGLLNKVVKSNELYPDEYYILAKFYMENGAFKEAIYLLDQGKDKNEGNIAYKEAYVLTWLGELKPIQMKLNYHFFGNLKQEDALLIQAIAKNLEAFDWKQLKLDKKIATEAYKTLTWINTLMKAQNKNTLQKYKMNYSSLRDYSQDLYYYDGLNDWTDGDTKGALDKFRHSLVKEEIECMRLFWMGYISSEVKEKLMYFNAAIQAAKKRKQNYSDAIYFRGLTLQKEKKDWKKGMNDFTEVLKRNPFHWEAREKRGYAWLQKQESWAIDSAKRDFNVLYESSQPLYKSKGIIGKALIDPTFWDTLPLHKTLREYNPYSFLESCLLLKRDKGNALDSARNYITKHKELFEKDEDIDFIQTRMKEKVIDLNVDALLEVPTLVWRVPYSEDDTIISWQKKELAIEFEVQSEYPEQLKSIELYVKDNILFKILKSKDSLTMNHKIDVPKQYLTIGAIIPITIKVNYKGRNKAIQRSKQISYEAPYECDCPKKVAFIFQNTQYQNKNVTPLDPNAQEAKELSKLLIERGFGVKTFYNLTKDSFEAVLKGDYIRAVKEHDLILLYYTGHGKSAQGNNYLLSTDYQSNDTKMIAAEMIYKTINDSLAGFSNRNPRSFIHIFDMCRYESYNQMSQTHNKKIDKETKSVSNNTVIIYTTYEGGRIRQGTRTQDGKRESIYINHLRKRFAKASEAEDIVQLFDTRGMVKSSEHTAEIFYNLKFNIFLKRMFTKKK